MGPLALDQARQALASHLSAHPELSCDLSSMDLSTGTTMDLATNTTLAATTVELCNMVTSWSGYTGPNPGGLRDPAVDGGGDGHPDHGDGAAAAGQGGAGGGGGGGGGPLAGQPGQVQ